jgi:MYXO-CTERM domain-containing protein
MNFRKHLGILASLLFLTLLVPSAATADMNGQEDKQDKKKRQNNLSANNTAFRGAELLSQGKQISSGKVEAPKKNQSATAYWSGDTLNLEVKSKNGNRVALKIEFFWFEATMKRGSDFYVAIVRGNSSPNIGASGCTSLGSGSWTLSTPTKIRGKKAPAQFVNIKSTQSGQGGAIRWDWSIPFQTYRYEPKQDVTIEQQYSMNAGANAQGSVEGSAGIEANGKDIQGKGSLGVNGSANASHKVSTDYTITLYRWETRVSSGPGGIEWALMPLDPKKATDNAYHEYYLALQSESRGKPAVIPEINFGGTFECERASYLPDKNEKLSATVKNIEMTPPPKANCSKNERIKNGKCVPRCSQNEKLQNGQCVPDCAQDEIFKNGKCLPKCAQDEKRVNGQCVPKCAQDEVFKNGKCQPKYKSCSADSDCGKGKICANGKCKGPKCVTSSDCGNQEICDAGRCRRVECMDDSDCQSNERCNSAGQCVTKSYTTKPDAGSTGNNNDTGSGSNTQPQPKQDTGSSAFNPGPQRRADVGMYNPKADTGTSSSKQSSGKGKQYRYNSGGCSSTGGSAPAGGFLAMALLGLAGLLRRRDE